MSGPGLNLSDMGIGTTENADTLTRPDAPRYTEEQFLSELGQMVDNEGGVDDIAAASPVQAPPMRELRPDTTTPRPAVIDPTADNSQAAGTQATGEGTGDSVVTPTGGELSDETVEGQTSDGLPFKLPPTGDDQTASPGGDGGGGGNGPTGASYEPTPAAPPAIDLNRIAQEVYGAGVTEDQARQILRLAKDFDSLNPQQLAGINQIVNGGYVPQQYTQQYTQQPTFQPAPIQQPLNQPPPQWTQPQVSQQQVQPVTLPQIDDPDLQQYLAPLYQQNQQLQQMFQAQQAAIAQEAQYRMQREHQAAVDRANQATNEWFTQHQDYLSPEDRIILEQRAIDSGLLPVFNQQFGDSAKAVEATLNYVFTNDATYQERVIARKVQEQQAALAQQQQRTNLSTALSGGGGAKPMNNGGTPRQPGGQTQNGYSNLVDGIAEILSQQN